MQRLLIAALLVLVAAVGVQAQGPVHDKDVIDWCEAFDRARTHASANGEYARHQRWQVADEFLRSVEPRDLTQAQIGILIDRGVLEWSRRRHAFRTRLRTLADEPTADGARAAMRAIALFDGRMNDAGRAELIRHAFAHLQIGETIHEAPTWEAVDVLRDVDDATLVASAEALLEGVQSLDPARVRADHCASFPGLQEVMVRALDGARVRETDEARSLMIARLTELAAGAPARTRAKIDEARVRLNGAYLRGELLGHPAPPMTFRWSNHEPPIDSLADLRGKVVVLDFWATWCSPCLASIPDVQDLQARYAGHDVVILGVTSLQGYHMSYADGANRRAKRIETRGAPEREFELMGEFVTERGITWPVAFSHASVYDPEFYVRGIPHVVIIDAEGVVRHRGLHPMDRFSPKPSKADRIDALLREAGLRVPGDKAAADAVGAP